MGMDDFRNYGGYQADFRNDRGYSDDIRNYGGYSDIRNYQGYLDDIRNDEAIRIISEKILVIQQISEIMVIQISELTGLFG